MIDLSSLSMTEIIRLQTRLQDELTRRFERPLALVFSDIVGSTAYFAQFGDSQGRQLQQLHFDLVAETVPGSDGRIVSTAGDGAFLVFPSANAAVAGVIEFQRKVAGANQGRGRAHQLQVRIGLHWGPVLTDGSDVSGDAVNLCARVGASADPGEVRLSRALFQELDRGHKLNCRPLGRVPMKGIEHPVEVLVLDWRDPSRFPRLAMVEETGERIVLPQQDTVTFGRLALHAGERANDVVLNHADPNVLRQVSRWHFELRRSEHGLKLVSLSDGQTTVDGVRLERGDSAEVRAGSQIGVADVLYLRLVGTDLRAPEADDGSTMMVVKTGDQTPQ